MKLTTGLKILGATLVLAAPAVSHATISVITDTFTYNQDFTVPATTATMASWANDATLAGWSLFAALPSPGVPITQIGINNGSSSVGAFYSYGVTGSTDRALGGLGAGTAYFGMPATGAPAGVFAVGFTNNSGHAISRVTISFDGEQWRDGGNTSAQTMVLQYGVGASVAAVPIWRTPGGNFDWSSPIHTNSARALDGNAAANRITGLGGNIEGPPPWEDGDTLWIRWIERNDPGADHGLAIDNFKLTITPIPEPSSVALFAAGAAFLGAFQIRRRRRDR